MKLAILDDYQNVALGMADWSPLAGRCAIEVLRRKLAVPDEAAEVLADCDILCTMRERTAIPRALIERLPRLKLITVTGFVHRTLDHAAARERGIVICGTDTPPFGPNTTAELAWGLILSLARQLPDTIVRMRSGGWQDTLGTVLAGKTLGLIGLGRIGRHMAAIGRAFGMEVIAWSQNMTAGAAAAAGATRVEKDELFARSDVVSIHVVLGDRTRGLVGARELALMKPTAYLVNTARSPIIDQTALIAALEAGSIAGAGLDVFDEEPLADDHPIRTAPRVILTPHLGYTVRDLFSTFYEQTVANVVAFLDGKPIRVVS